MARIRAKNGNVLEVEDEVHIKSLLLRGHELIDDDGTSDDVDEHAGPLEPNGRSTKAEWRAWAEHLGLEVPDGAKTADIKALVAEHAESQSAGTTPDDDEDDEGDDESSDDVVTD
jgi:hypothetical protein